MENIINNELLFRGFSVDIGIVDSIQKDPLGKSVRKKFEVDFVANRDDSRIYIQSAYSIPNEEKMIQETKSLRNSDDSFKRVIVVKEDTIPHCNDKGILIINLFDFLLTPQKWDSR